MSYKIKMNNLSYPTPLIGILVPIRKPGECHCEASFAEAISF